MKKEPSHRPKRSELSFTLLETMIATTLMVTILMHVTRSQGDIVYNSNYAKNMTEAIWLAKSVMSRVEYFWQYQEFSSLEQEGKAKRAAFKDMGFDEDQYRYDLQIIEWDFPLLELLEAGGLNKGEGEEEEPAAEPQFPIKDMLKAVLGDEILKVANVEVFWSEGSKEHSVRLSYLLTNQREVDEQLMQRLGPTYEKLMQFVENEGKPEKKKKNEKKMTPAECVKIGGTYENKTKECKGIEE